MFFLTVGRPALRSAAESAATEVMGFIHLFGDRRMPTGLAISSDLLLVLFGGSRHRAFYLLSLSMLILFVVIYNPSQNQSIGFKAAAKTGGRLDGARVLQASWDRSLTMRVPLLAVSMLAQGVHCQPLCDQLPCDILCALSGIRRTCRSSALVDGSIDESARTFVHKLLSHLIEARQIARTTLPKGRPSIR